MEDAGTRIALGVLPVSIAKTDDGRLLVELSNGSKELFDTVVAAVGKYVCAHESSIVILNKLSRLTCCQNPSASGILLISTVQYSTVQYSTVQYSTVQYSTVQYSIVQYSIAQYSTFQYSTKHCNILLHTHNMHITFLIYRQIF